MFCRQCPVALIKAGEEELKVTCNLYTCSTRCKNKLQAGVGNSIVVTYEPERKELTDTW